MMTAWRSANVSIFWHYIPVVLVSALLFSDERNIFVVGAALVAAGAVFWSHWEHHRVAIARRTLAFVVWAAVAAPIEARHLQRHYWHIGTLLLFGTVRSGVIASRDLSLFSKHAHRLPAQAIRLSFLPAALFAIAVTLYFYSFQRLGIVTTVPAFFYSAAVGVYGRGAFLKRAIPPEKVGCIRDRAWRNHGGADSFLAQFERYARLW